MCGPECGDIYRPPSRGNMSLFAIIELVVMGVVGLVCFVDLYRMLTTRDGGHLEVWEILRIVEYTLIVIGLIFIVVGLFCSPSQRQIYTGIVLFFIGTILAIIITVYLIKEDQIEDSLGYNIFYIIILTCLAYILWKQSYHL